jgi:hypothetical protein
VKLPPVRNAAFGIARGVGICVHNARNPSHQEWDEFLAMSFAVRDAIEGDAANFKQLIFTDGGGPNAAQRTASKGVAKGGKNSHKIKVALVSRSVVARGIVTAYRWLGFPLRSFTPEQLSEAFAFLAVSDAVAMDICAAVEELSATIDGPVRSAAWVEAYRTKLKRATAS